jgi:hypothetical protein
VSILGTLDFTQFRAQDGDGTKRVRYGMYTGPASYSNYYTNAGTGDPAIPGDFMLGQIHLIFFDTALNVSGVPLSPVYVSAQMPGGPPNGAILWMQWNTNAEVANGTALNGYSVYFEAIGI